MAKKLVWRNSTDLFFNIPNFLRASIVTFWATPPHHGCLIPEVIFQSKFVFKLPENLSYAEGAMIEPLAVGLQAAEKATIIPGDIALVMGCGPIGLVIALSALAGGCSKVFIAAIISEKLFWQA